MDVSRWGQRGAAPLVTAALTVLAVVGAVLGLVLPISVSPERIDGVTLPCGSMIDPGPVGYPYYCDGAQADRAFLVVGLLIVAAVLAAVAVVLGSARRSDGWRIVRWSAWPVTYAICVLGAWVVTYPYVLTREGDISGLEYLFQLAVSVPLGWFVTGLGDGSAGERTSWLLAAGLVQVALVSWFCRWGYRRSRDRAQDVRERPAERAPVT